jgi:hypothetical protein
MRESPDDVPLRFFHSFISINFLLFLVSFSLESTGPLRLPSKPRIILVNPGNCHYLNLSLLVSVDCQQHWPPFIEQQSHSGIAVAKRGRWQILHYCMTRNKLMLVEEGLERLHDGSRVHVYLVFVVFWYWQVSYIDCPCCRLSDLQGKGT